MAGLGRPPGPCSSAALLGALALATLLATALGGHESVQAPPPPPPPKEGVWPYLKNRADSFCSDGFTRLGTMCIRTAGTTTFTNAAGRCGSDRVAFAREKTELEALVAWGGQPFWTNAAKDDVYYFDAYRNYPSAGVWTWTDARPTFGAVSPLSQLPFSAESQAALVSEQPQTPCVIASTGGQLREVDCGSDRLVLCVEKRSDQQCPPGFIQTGSACVYGSPGKAKFEDAVASCRGLQADLYEPRELGLFDDINTATSELEKDSFWVGLKEMYTGDYRFASDWSTPISSYFQASNSRGPISDANPSGNCVKLQSDGQLVAAPCGDLNYFYCLYRPRDICPAGFLAFGESSDCYYYKDTLPSSSRDEAAKRCTAVHASLGHYNDLKTAESFGAWTSGEEKLWLGVTDLLEDQLFTTADGMKPAAYNWASSEGQEDTMGCSITTAGYMYDTSCSSDSADGYLCHYKESLSNCPAGFLERAGRCYHLSDSELVFDEAKSACQALGSSLAKIDAPETAEVLANISVWDQPVTSRLVGLQLNSLNSMWENWDETNPPDGIWDTQPSSEDCAVVAATEGLKRLSPIACTTAKKYICEWQPELLSSAVPGVEASGECFLDRPNPFGPDFTISPGAYDPMALNSNACVLGCQKLGYMYAGLKNGMFCFCSDILRLAKVSTSLCDAPCTDSAVTEYCGGADDHVTVFSTGGSDPIPSPSLSVDWTLQPTDTDFTFTATVETNRQLYFSFDFGDGSDPTLPSTELTTLTYKYSLPGTYKVTVIVTDPPVGQVAFASTSVTVEEYAGWADLDCPDVSEPGDELTCDSLVPTGKNMTYELYLDKQAEIKQSYTLPDPEVRGLGLTPPQHETAELQQNAALFTMGIHLSPEPSGRRVKRSHTGSRSSWSSSSWSSSSSSSSSWSSSSSTSWTRTTVTRTFSSSSSTSWSSSSSTSWSSSSGGGGGGSGGGGGGGGGGAGQGGQGEGGGALSGTTVIRPGTSASGYVPEDSSFNTNPKTGGISVGAAEAGSSVEGVLGDIYGAATVIMPWARVTDQSILVGFEYYATKAGTLTFMVFRPSCPGVFCYSSNRCDAPLCDDVDTSTVACDSGDPFYTQARQCEASMCGGDTEAVPPTASTGNNSLPYTGVTGYTAVFSVSETVSGAGYSKVLVDTTLAGATWLQPGDVIGFSTEGAQIGWRLTRPGEVSDVGMLGSTESAESTSGTLEARHYLRAIVSTPVRITVNHTYDEIGRFEIMATTYATGQIESYAGTGQAIDVQVPVRGLKVTLDPEHVTVNNKTNITVTLTTGSFVTVKFQFGEAALGGTDEEETSDNVENDAWSKIYWYRRGDPGPRYVIITAKNQWGTLEFRHTLYVQRKVTDKWFLLDNAPVLWPVPGDVNFTVVYPANLQLPTMASAQLFTGDGYVIEWEIPEEREQGEVYEVGFNRTYEFEGTYRAKLRVYNLASEFEMTNRVPVWAEIKNLTTLAYYLPFLPIGGEAYLPGSGPELDSFPIERNVSFFLNMTQGTIFQYMLEMDNGTFLTNSSTSPVDYIFPEPGTYAVSLYGWNPLQGRSLPVNVTVKVLESAMGAIIDDYLLVSEAKSAKDFEIRMESVGTYACLVWNPGDGSKIHAYGDRDTCHDEYPPGTYIYGGVIRNPMPMRWTYMRKGQYVMTVHAFNFLSASRYELRFTVSSIPCRPPDLRIRDNSTKFWMPKEFYRADAVKLVTVCAIDCNASLETTKTWKAIMINESWGTEIGSVDLSPLDSYQKSILFVPQRYLEYGTFKFEYSIQISGEGMDPSQPFIKRVYTYVKIKKSPLSVTLVEGGSSAIARGYDQIILLEPEKFSLDPDYPEDRELEYWWFCRRMPDEELSKTRTGWLRPTEPLQNPIMNATAELYDWVFDNVTNTTYEVEKPDLGGCFGQGPGMLNVTGGILQLNTLELRTNNITLEINVQMRKKNKEDNRKAIGTILVDVVPGAPPIVRSACQVADMCRVSDKGSIINPSSRVALVGMCEEFCDGPLRWNWKISYVRNFTEYKIKNSDQYIIGVGRPQVAIKKSLYSDYPGIFEFRVQLGVTRLFDSETGIAMMYLLLNQAPTGGTCSVTPPEGRVVNLQAQGVSAEAYDPAMVAPGAQDDIPPSNDTDIVAPVVYPIPGRALTEDWYVECKDFKDPDGDKIGKYIFFIKDSKEGFTRTLKFGKDREDRFVFPYGSWEFYVTIFDNFDAARDILIDIIMTSTPTKGEYSSWEARKDLARAMGEGDQARLNQLLQARASLQEITLPDDPVEEVTTTAAYDDYDGEPEVQTMDPEELAELLAEQERLRLETLGMQAEENRLMLIQAKDLNQDTLDDCTLVLGTTAAIIGDGKAVDSVGKEAAVNAVGGKCLQSVLMNGTINDPKQAEGMVTSNMGTITAVGRSIDNTNLNGNLVPSDMVEARRRRSADYESEACEEESEDCQSGISLVLEEQKRKAAQQVPAMMESAKAMQEKLLSIALPGEDPFTLKTPDGLEMTLVMMEGWQLDGYRIPLGEGMYQFPSLCAILHAETNCSEAYNMTIGIQAINWPTLLYSYGEGTDLVSKESKNMQLKLVSRVGTTTELEQIPVYDLPGNQRISIRVPRGKKGSKPALPEPSFVEPRPNSKEIMMYHSFNVTRPYVAISVEVGVSRPDAQLVVFMRRGGKPTLTQYDWVWKIQLPTNFTVDVASEPIEEPIPLRNAVPLTTIRVPPCEDLEGSGATYGTNVTCIPGGIREPVVMCKEDLISVAFTTPVPPTEGVPIVEDAVFPVGDDFGGSGSDYVGSDSYGGSQYDSFAGASEGSSSDTDFGGQQSSYSLDEQFLDEGVSPRSASTATTGAPTTTGAPNATEAADTRNCTRVLVTPTPTDNGQAEPVAPTKYVSEYVRLSVVPSRALEPYDPYGNDTLLYSFPLYNIFVPDWYVDNMTDEYWVGVAEFSNTTDDEIFFDDPSATNLTWANMTNVYSTNYTMRIYTSGCLFYNPLTDIWGSDGCTVTGANYRATMCTCNHLTSFGSGFFVVPNTIDFEYVFANAGFTDNLSIYLTIILTFAVYLILMFWARWKDKQDLKKIGVTPLPDNNPNHKYLYEILVFTGNKTNSECDSRVQFMLSGEKDETEIRTLADPDRPILRRGGADSFVMAVPRPLGSLSYLRIWHDNSGKGGAASWFLNYIVVRDIQTGDKMQFIANKWFAVEEGDGAIDRLVPVAGREQMLEFQHLFNTTSRKNLQDGHLWFSVFMRPARSRFTRVQRVSCCMALLYLSMLVNAMWYGLVPDQPTAGAVSFGPFSFSPEQIGVGMMANLIVFPPSFLIVLLFRKSRPRRLRENRAEKALIQQRERQRKEGKWPEETEETAAAPTATAPASAKSSAAVSQASMRSLVGEDDEDEKKSHERPKKFSLPWWCVYFAWFLTLASMGTSIFFLWAYGITFGNAKTTKWLTSLVISFFSSVLFTQPIKVLLTAMLVSAICKKLDTDHDDIDDDEEDPTLRADEEWLHAPRSKKKRRKIEYKPVDPVKIAAAKREREKEVKMWDILTEMAAYAFFLWILLVLSYGSRDPNAFLIRASLEQSFIRPRDPWLSFKAVRNETRFWNWTRSVMVPELKIGEDYAGKKPRRKEKKLITDRVHLLLGNGIMRQVRIREKNTCRVPKVMRNVTNDCHKFANIIYEEHRDFGIGWDESLAGKRPYNLKEYRYRTSGSLDSYPFWGDIAWYGGGGYVLDLKGSAARLTSEMWRLQRNRWVDEFTRAVFIEFSLFNAQVNLFVGCTIVAEFSPDGGIIPFFKFQPVRLLTYSSGFGLFVMICDVTFVIFVIYYTVREIKRGRKQKGQYWKDPWNYLEVTVIILGYTAIVFYLYRMYLSSRIVDAFKRTRGRGYIKLQYVTYLDEMFGYMIGFLVFFGTLKFIKLLRFNKRMGFLTSTLKQCAGDLWGFIIIFLVIFCSFSFSFFLLLGHSAEDFFSFISSLESSFSMMLGRFHFDQIRRANHVLGPALFFTFTISMTVVFINIFLTIIIKSFQSVKNDLLKQSNEYEVVDFLINRVKMITGLGKPKLNSIGPLAPTDEEERSKDPSEKFPEKVDQLLNYVNDFYFEGRMDLDNKAWLKRTINAEKAKKGSGKGKGRRSAKNTMPPEELTEEQEELADI